jgi:small-conductance mechanosensitive channel
MSTYDANENLAKESHERYARHLSRQVILSEKRNRTTDVLPGIPADSSNGKLSARQITQLRDENRRLHHEVTELQSRIAQYSGIEAQFEQEIDTIHHAHQLEIEQYQSHLREMMDELNQKQRAAQEMEQRYQELYHAFQDAVEEEAGKLVTEAAQTMVLSPEHTPPILHDVVKTLEFQVKQTEDQHVAELMALMRQVQRKNILLEQELAQERENLFNERQKVYEEQKRMHEQSILRHKMIDAHLRTRFATLVTSLTSALLLVYAVIALGLYKVMKFNIYWSVFLPLLVCALLAFFIVRLGSHARYFRPPVPAKKK